MQRHPKRSNTEPGAYMEGCGRFLRKSAEMVDPELLSSALLVVE